MNQDKALREQLIGLMIVKQAHMTFEEAVEAFPLAQINTRPPNVDYTFWHLIEHIRLCQRDILDYIIDENYVDPTFPDDYWVDDSAEATPADWYASIDQFLADRQAFVDILNDPATDLFAPLPNSGERAHNILREIEICGAHNAFHIGEIGVLRQVMGLW